MTGILGELGLSPAINASGPLTRRGGHRLAPAVLDAMAEVGRVHVSVDELQAAAGQRVAEVTGAEAGYVTSGAAAGLLLATAACIARGDVAAMDQLPHLRGPRSEVLVQRLHRNAYDRVITDAGGQIVEVGYVPGVPGGGPTRWQLESAITNSTAAIAWPVQRAVGALTLPEVVQIAHRRNIPVIVDAAASLPPVANLQRFINEGADLVTFSGGKAIGGPQASGILCGRLDLIQSVALQHQDFPGTSPESWVGLESLLGRIDTLPSLGIGRPMKVGKETIAGLVAALDRFLSLDEAAELARQRCALQAIAEELPQQTGWAYELRDSSFERWSPILQILWEGSDAPTHASELISRLQKKTPRIFVVEKYVSDGAIGIDASTLSEEDVPIVATRLRTLLT